MITLRDVAERAGVSVSTASNALSGSRSVSPNAVKGVLEAAAELGYRRNETARSLRTGLRNSIALVIPDVTNPFWAALAGVVEGRANVLGWSVALCNTDYDASREGSYLARLINSVDGILLLSTSPDPEAVAPLVRLGIPVVACDERISLEGIGGVYSENVGGGKQAAHHLVDRGGTRFVVLGGPSQLATPGERVAGFLEGLAERGIDPSRVHRFDAPYSFDGGREGARRAVAAIPDVDAVFACNDNQAMGVMFELEDLGRRVPDDVIVCGFDGISWSMRVRPSLTTLQQDSTAMAEQAFEMLTAMIVEGVPPRTVVLPVELVERESTNRPAGASSLLGV